MLYTLIKGMAVTSIKTFFNTIQAEHIETIPKDAPIIFTSNHPNTMMDPIIIGYTCKRKLHFFAKSTLFNSPLAGWFLKQLNIIPVYRKQDDPKQMHRNEQAFQKGFEILKQNKSFLIFPEGVSTGNRILSEIKTGAARIALGAESEHDWELGVTIIPVGLNYSQAVQFRSDVLVRYGKPIVLSDFKDLYKQDEIEAVHRITTQIEVALSKLTTTIKDLEMQEIVEALETIYKQELAADLGMEIKNKSEDFSVTKGLINAVEWYYSNQPKKTETFAKMLRRYQRTLYRLKIKDEFLDPNQDSVSFFKRIRIISYFILTFPFFLFGVITNIIPYKFPRWYAEHFVKHKAEIASWKMITGIGVFLIGYSIETIIVYSITQSLLLTLLFVFALIPGGNFVLKYNQKVRDYRQHLRFISVFYRKRNLIYELIKQRQELIAFLNTCKNEYLNAVILPVSK